MSQKLKFLDLFAGAGGLSEGFIQAGFEPIAHVELDAAACFTLRTRMAYHWLNEKGDTDLYVDYLKKNISRPEFYSKIPSPIINSVINAEISKKALSGIFEQIDALLGGKKLDLIIGGPPCQAYSLIGRSRDQNRMQGDQRNYLYVYYAEFLKRYKPTYFVFENVTGLLSAKDKNGNHYFQLMRDLFRKRGYETEFDTLSAEDYGVLQKRKRIILVGRRGGKTGFYPTPELWVPGAKVKEVFKGLPELQAGEGRLYINRIRKNPGSWLTEAGIFNPDIPITLHEARPHSKQDLEIYRKAVELWNDKKQRLDYNDLPERLKTHKNRAGFFDRFKVVAEDESACHTVVAHIAKDGHYYIHPDVNQNRSITPREAARLQTFPDDYYFESGSGITARTPAFKQIGNAVPVLLARKIAESMKENWI